MRVGAFIAAEAHVATGFGQRVEALIAPVTRESISLPVVIRADDPSRMIGDRVASRIEGWRVHVLSLAPRGAVPRTLHGPTAEEGGCTMPLYRDQADAMITHLRLTFEGTDGDLNITYRPNLLSRSEFRRLRELAESPDAEDDDDGIAPLLCRAIIGWDFLQEDGQPYPIDLDALGVLGYPIQQQIVQEMLRSPNARSGRRSDRSSAESRVMPPIEHSRSSSDGTGRSLSPI